MNIFVSNQNPASGVVWRRSMGAAWNTGDVVTALLSDVTGGKATLRTEDGFTFTANAADLQGQVGDTLSFQVNRKRDGFSLTQILERRTPQGAEQAERGNATLIDGYEENKELANNIEAMKEADELRAEYRQERAAKIQRVIASIRRGQNFIGGGGKSVFGAIAESGLDLSKISFADLNRVMHSVERDPKREISPGELAEGLNRAWGRAENARHIVTSLFNHGLAVSDKNVSAMEYAYDRLPESVPATAIEELISKEQVLTLDNVYKSCHAYGDGAKDAKPANNPAQAAPVPQEVIENFFTREGIKITPENLQTARFLLDRDLPLSRENIQKVQFLQNLTRTMKNIPQAISGELFFDQAAEHLASDIPMGAIRLTEVTRFAEAQLKLAIEAANRHQNLNIDTDALREQLRGLQINEETALRFLKMAGAKAEPQEAVQITSLFDAIATLKPLTANVHAGVMQGDIDFTVKGVSEAVLYAKATAGYEQNATVPMAKFGDSINKVKDQFAPLLENMGITATSENAKAAFILSKNSMDVTEENLTQVKIIDAKITAIADNLHPMIAANMIKDGLIPLNMHADQVLAYIKQFNLSMGEDGADKISRYIMEMDDAGALDPDTRKSMIAIYRMLNVIQRDGAAALGLAAQMENLKAAPMTLGDLLNLAQKPKKTDTNITDAYGQLERLTRPAESIRAILESAAAPTYSELVTESFIGKVSPKSLNAMMNASLGQPIEDLAMAAHDEASASVSKPEAATTEAAIQSFISASPEVINSLQSRGISATAGNIRAFERLSSSRRALADELETAADKASESEVTSESAAGILDAIPDSSLSELREGQATGQILARILSALGDSGASRTEISNLLAITHGLNGGGEQGFQIPVKINGKVSNLSLYVLNENALTGDGARVLMSLDTERLGVVNTYFTISGSSVDINISAETHEAVEALASNQAQLEALLAEAGATVGEFTFSPSQEPAADSAASPPSYTPRAETAYDFRV
ncbi:MAG: flagellar hook-length control protein FliK [Defluviitaleaceae bacterium]|nr:flagellar hook-length control protein FliK [Defluviitaleaceae bacterium]